MQSTVIPYWPSVSLLPVMAGWLGSVQNTQLSHHVKVKNISKISTFWSIGLKWSNLWIFTFAFSNQKHSCIKLIYQPLPLFISEFINQGGQGYCQGGFSADFTKVTLPLSSVPELYQLIWTRNTWSHSASLSGWESGAWRTRQLLLARYTSQQPLETTSCSILKLFV